MRKTTREALDAYYHEADSWATDREASLRRSTRVAWMVAGVASTIALCEAIAITALTPLKTVEPYTLMVDRQTGHVQALEPLDVQKIAPDRALTQSFLVQYVIARESFDAVSLQEQYRKAALWSADTARSQYISGMQASNPDSPLARYPRSTVIETRVKSVSPLNGERAMVRFDTLRRDRGGVSRLEGSWISILRFRYSGEPMRLEDRFLNPLGFQVLHYRRDAEAIPANTDPASSSPAPGESRAAAS